MYRRLPYSGKRNILRSVIVPAVDTRTETHPGTFSPPPSSFSARSGVLCLYSFYTQASSLNFSLRFLSRRRPRFRSLRKGPYVPVRHLRHLLARIRAFHFLINCPFTKAVPGHGKVILVCSMVHLHFKMSLAITRSRLVNLCSSRPSRSHGICAFHSLLTRICSFHYFITGQCFRLVIGAFSFLVIVVSSRSRHLFTISLLVSAFVWSLVLFPFWSS
jgi:hypothetical protein